MAYADDLLAAVGAAVETAAGVRAFVRTYPDSTLGDPAGHAVVALTAERFEPATGEADWAWWGYYTVGVTLLRPRAGAATPIDPAEWQARRTLARQACLDFRALGLAWLDDADYAPGKTAAPGTDPARRGGPPQFDSASFAVTYRTREPRHEAPT